MVVFFLFAGGTLEDEEAEADVTGDGKDGEDDEDDEDDEEEFSRLRLAPATLDLATGWEVVLYPSFIFLADIFCISLSDFARDQA